MTKDYFFEDNLNLMAEFPCGEKVYFSGPDNLSAAWCVKLNGEMVKSGFSKDYGTACSSASSFIRATVGNVTQTQKSELRHECRFSHKKYKALLKSMNDEIDEKRKRFTVELSEAKVYK